MKRIMPLMILCALLVWKCAKMPDTFFVLPPISGLVAYYPFNGNAKDESGNKYDGIVHGATLTNDRFGNQNKAYKFDGIDDYIDCGDILNELNFPFTISCWIYIQNFEKTNYLNIFCSDFLESVIPIPSYNGFVLYCSNIALINAASLDEPELGILYGDGTGNGEQARRTKQSDSTMPNNRWVYVAATVRGQGNIEFYINAENVSGSYSGSGGNIVHNNWHAFIGYLFNGYIDELYIFDRALSSTEISQLFNSAN